LSAPPVSKPPVSEPSASEPPVSEPPLTKLTDELAHDSVPAVGGVTGTSPLVALSPAVEDMAMEDMAELPKDPSEKRATPPEDGPLIAMMAPSTTSANHENAVRIVATPHGDDTEPSELRFRPESDRRSPGTQRWTPESPEVSVTLSFRDRHGSTPGPTPKSAKDGQLPARVSARPSQAWSR